MDDYNKSKEELLIELKKQDEEKNKKLIYAVWLIISMATAFYLFVVILSSNVIKDETMLNIVMIISTLLFVATAFIALKFEIDAGYYECKNCHHRFKAEYKEAVFAVHVGMTRYLKCPKCGKKSWSKKVMRKE